MRIKLEDQRKHPILYCLSCRRRTDWVTLTITNLSAARERGGELQNILLTGPPGTGKSLLAKRVAMLCGLDYAIISGGIISALGNAAALEAIMMTKLFSRHFASHVPVEGVVSLTKPLFRCTNFSPGQGHYKAVAYYYLWMRQMQCLNIFLLLLHCFLTQGYHAQTS